MIKLPWWIYLQNLLMLIRVSIIIKQDSKREKRIRALMDYSFEMCIAFGGVFNSDDNKACALIVYPDKKKSTLKSALLDIKLILRAIGIGNISKTVRREKIINSIQPTIKMAYPVVSRCRSYCTRPWNWK